MTCSLRMAACLSVTLMLNVLGTAARSLAADPVFKSPVVTSATPGHAVEIDVELKKARKLFLVVTDGGNGYACDWADWAEPRLTGPAGEKKLTDLKWKSASTGWGQVRKNQNAGSDPLKINGKPVEYGIGTHANSIIEFDVPQGFTHFRARGGLDDGGTSQQGGKATSVQFLVYFAKPKIVVAGSGGGDAGSRELKDALAGLEAGQGLEAQLFAGEPQLLSPSNIDIDHRGRVWVCEIVNYRRHAGRRPEGDRILILADTDGDGRVDSEKVFYQGKDIDSPHGVCVLGTPDGKGTKVIVSAGDKVQVFTDEDGDDRPDKQETLFSGISGTQHDHGIHSFLFGPDGRLYFNFGNYGRQLKDKDGKPIVDMAGNEVNVSRNPYQEGMVFRCRLDGSELETLGWNFRNNWEVTVDSFGTIWQSDNDDDGNRGVRINYVMEYGNYGYKDEFTGAGWKSPRTGMHSEVPLRHWHLNDPGVMPNLLQTGAGSPTGICAYEGTLLPEVYRNEIIHCDAGPNIVRAYPAKTDGAGYSARIENVLEGTRDKWFRPSDVGIAPDGSLIIADWYDPGVGGHAMRDLERGRLFRVVPEGHTGYKVPEFDFSTPAGAAEALRNPNRAVRYIAWQALHAMQKQAEPELLKMYHGENPRHRARALWLLGQVEGRGESMVALAITDDDPNIRIVGVRLARLLKLNVIPYVKQLLDDSSAAVRRECLIALRHHKSPEMPKLWAELAQQHDGEDRWYLEALGLAADKRWEECFAAWKDDVGSNWNTPGGRDIVWRARTPAALPLLAELIADANTSDEERPRYFRALDFHRPSSDEQKQAKQATLIALATIDHPQQEAIAALALKHLGNVNLKQSPQLRKVIDGVLEESRGTERFVRLVDQFNLSDRYDDLLALAQSNPSEQIGVEAVRLLLAKNQTKMVEQALRDENIETATKTAEALANSGDARAEKILLPLVRDDRRRTAIRRQAVRGLASSRNGAMAVIALAESNKLAETLKGAAAAALHASTFNDVKQKAEKLFPLPPTKDNKPLPPLSQLIATRGDVAKGRLVFNTTGTCAKCHVVNGIGKEVGPNLSEIGKKLSRQAMFESILYPNAGISHNYETYVVLLASGNQVNGIITSQTPEEVTIKGADALTRTFKREDIELMKKQDISLMPADLQKVMTGEDLVNVVEYLTTLKQAAKP